MEERPRLPEGIPSSVVLYDWAPSPFCIKVRALLDYKGIAYERRPAFGAGIVRVWREGRIGKVPALEIDGEWIVDSTDIAHELERRFPHRPVVPRDARERALCHALEDWCDEGLYFIGLHYQWIDDEGAPLVPRAFGHGIAGRLGYRWYRRSIVRQLRGQGTGRKPPMHIASDMARAVDTVDALLADTPYLLGAAPLLCDFALFGQLVYWTRAPKTARALAGRPAIDAYLARMKTVREAGSASRGVG